MVNYCIDNLLEIKILLGRLSEENFKKKSTALFNSTIGEHVRHILEFYGCLIDGVNQGFINYDKRKRRKELEHNTFLCIEKITEIIAKLKTIPPEKALKVQANFDKTDSSINFVLESSLNRELGYCLEHSIHHQALIKSGLKEHKCQNLINKDFGVAASTLRNRNLCAQ